MKKVATQFQFYVTEIGKTKGVTNSGRTQNTTIHFSLFKLLAFVRQLGTIIVFFLGVSALTTNIFVPVP